MIQDRDGITRYRLFIKRDPPDVDWSEGQAQLILARKQNFYSSLLDRVNDCHDMLIKKQKEIVDKELYKDTWHHKFSLDSVPDIPFADIPDTEALDRKERDKKKQIIMNTTITTDKFNPKEVFNAPTIDLPIPKDLSGLDPTILAKIRAREQIVKQDEALAPERRKKYILASLPRLSDVLRALYQSERCTSMPMDTIISRLLVSLSPISHEDIEEELSAMEQAVPDWCKILALPNGNRFVKINKSVPFMSIKNSLQQLVSSTN